MYKRLFKSPKNKSFFLFGPRGTGKTTWLKSHFADAIYLDFLRPELLRRLLGSESRLEEYIPTDYQGWEVSTNIENIEAPIDIHLLNFTTKNAKDTKNRKTSCSSCPSW